MQEIRRVLLSRRRILLLFALSVCCAVHFFSPLWSPEGTQTRNGWAPYLETYRDMELPKVKHSLNKITDNGEDPFALDRYGRLFQNQVNYLVDYPEYLERIQWQAGTMLNVSIFMSDDQTLVKTGEDYKRMTGAVLTIGMDQAVTHAMGDTLSDWLLALYIAVTVFSFLSERKQGLWNAVCASPNGRTRLPLWRFACLLLAAVSGAAIFTATEAVSGWAVYGGFRELDRLVQSIEMFRGFTIPMTIGQFWLYYGLLRFLGGFLAGLFLWLFLELIPDLRLSVILFALFAGAEYALFRMLPEQSLFHGLNLFLWLSPRKLLTSYEAFSLFGKAFSRLEVFFGFALWAAIAGFGAILLCCRFRKPTEGFRWITGLSDWWRRRTACLGFHGRLLLHELYKMLVTGRGALILLVLPVICWSVAKDPYLGSDGEVVSTSLETLYRQSQGPLSSETEMYLLRQAEKLAQLQKEYNDLQFIYEKGRITEGEYAARSLEFRDLGEKEAALEAYRQQLQRLSSVENAHILPHWVYAELFGVGSNTLFLLQTLSLIAVVLLCLLYASTEGSTGMTKARRATACGRGKALAARYCAGFLFSALLSALIWLLQLYALYRSYGSLPFLRAPICCLQYFADTSPSVTVLGFWGIRTAVRTTLVSALSIPLLLVTDRLQS